MDPLEKEQLRRKMATRMGVFMESGTTVDCVSSHYYGEFYPCELCQTAHAQEIIVVKNRSGKKMHVAISCLKEMIRFKVTDVEDLPRWLEKLTLLKAEHEKKKIAEVEARAEERKRLEKKCIVRKRPAHHTA